MIDLILNKLRISRLRWHDMRDVKPVSRQFGFDRGTPIDRFYIERFLQEQGALITGKVLEVASSKYSERYGTKVTSYEVLHVEKSAQATIVGDLSRPETLPSDAVDCFISTQVYNFIYDFQAAIRGSYQLLRPGGVILATVSGISQVSRFDASRWGHFWSFYPQGIARSFEDVFGKGNVEVNSFGNSLSALALIKGLAVEELTPEELDYMDPDYPVTIAIIARKR